VSILERPVHGGEFISALVSALRGRRRQYEARDAILRRDQFLAMLGHELRNPLAAITLALETAPIDSGKELGGKQRAIIERQTRHLARLVDDLLDVARVTSGKVRLQTEVLDIREIAERCVHGAELAARSRGIELRAELSSHRIDVDGDAVRLEEILNNLIANALKYSPQGARVIVRTARAGSRCVVEVADTGIGIAPEMLDRVFDLFAQADGALDRSQGGLGIGLTLVRSLVRLHGGTIAARSKGLGHGSTFVVELPLSRTGARSTGAHLVSLPQQPHHLRILLVDDNVDVLEMTRELLEADGHEIACAADGPDGLARVVEWRPDVAFVDIGIPGLDGYDVARQARSRGSTSYLVAMTGYGQPDDRRRAFEAGFDRHLTKPVHAAMLRGVLDGYCETRSRPAFLAR
jgi:CheY-like chemotaxis protein/two-component sensor histidine kinase